MSALHKLKAYFGMVPADEIEEFEDETYADRQYDRHPVDDGYDGYDAPADRIGGRRRVGVRGGYQPEPASEPYEDVPRADDHREVKPPVRRQWPAEAPPRPAGGERESVSRLRAVTDTGSMFNLSKITTLHPRSYSEARTIGEQYRDGSPVIMNLTEMDEADAKRLVDFAAGLAFALRGSIEKVTNRVFLLSPPNVDVAAEDKRKLAEGAFFNYG